MTQVLKEDTT